MASVLEVDELTMYILVRADLKMGTGKVAGQCCHAVQSLILSPTLLPELLAEYTGVLHPKIILKIPDEATLDSFVAVCVEHNFPHHVVVDLGRTQIAANTRTVLGIGPIRKSTVPDSIRVLKLY